MKRICFIKIDKHLKIQTILGYKEFNNDEEDSSLHAYGKERCSQIQEIMGEIITYHIEKQQKDGSWSIQAYLSPNTYTK